MAFQQLRLTISGSDFEKVSEALENLGALSVSFLDAEDNPIYEPQPGTTPMWDKVVVTALFPEDQKLVVETIEDQAWERVCMDQFKPQRFGEHLWICPSWDKIDDPKAVIVNLDPGLAFGTGSHPTTQLCLDWLANNNIKNKIILDYGCGSGILSIAAAKLGAQKVIGVDIDPQALQATLSNAKDNQVIIETLLPYELNSPKVDIILANILANPLIELAGQLISYLNPQGMIILSGILEDQVELIKLAYQKLALKSETLEDGWARLVYYKPSLER